MPRKSMYEVFFKGHHVMHFPWGENTEKVILLDKFATVPFQNEEITVTRLCHVTHNEPADIIEQEDCFEFKPKKKYGKDTSNNRVSAVICKPTHRAPDNDTEYRVVTKDQELLPGYYSWWSIDSSCFPAKRSDDPHICKDFTEYEVSNEFALPHKSRFGSKKISGDLTKLLQCYQEAIASKSMYLGKPQIEFRCGGTLRYNRQACKVIIICQAGSPELHEYPLFRSFGFYLRHNAQSQVEAYGTLKLVIKNGIMMAGSERYSWDTYAFAFYFPSKSYIMKCPKPRLRLLLLVRPDSLDFEITDIEHDESRCTGKVRGQCPNNSYVPRKRKRNDRDDDDDDDDDKGPIVKKKMHTMF